MRTVEIEVGVIKALKNECKCTTSVKEWINLNTDVQLTSSDDRLIYKFFEYHTTQRSRISSAQTYKGYCCLDHALCDVEIPNQDGDNARAAFNHFHTLYNEGKVDRFCGNQMGSSGSVVLTKEDS